MKQNPNRTKFKRYHRVQASALYLNEQRQFMPTWGFYGLKALSSGKLSFSQIEAARRSIRRITKKNGEIFIQLFMQFPITKKSSGSRMGRGKGLVSHWVAHVRRGQILYELNTTSEMIAFKALRSAGTKLPVRTRWVKQIY